MRPHPSKSTYLWIGLALTLLALPLLHRPVVTDPMVPSDRAEQERLPGIVRHTPADSPEQIAVSGKLQRLEAGRDEREGEAEPRPEHPEEFARILAEMRIPAGKTESGYAPGYRYRETDRAAKAAPAKAALPWVERGPGNVSGRARGLIVDPDDPAAETWWVGSVGGGIWKTTDGGASWSDVAPDLPNLPVSWLAMAASDHDVLYAGTGEAFFNVDTINGNGILKSIDHGMTWNPLASAIDDVRFNNISRIVVDPSDPDVVLASTTTGFYKMGLNLRSSIFRSTDGGTNWTEVYAETDVSANGRVKKILQIVPTPGDFDVLYATIDEKGILKSTDAGQTWMLANNGITDFTGRFEVAVSPVDANRIFAAAEGASFSQLWVSSDAAGTWTQTLESGGSEPDWLGAQGWYDNTIVCHPTDLDIVYVGGIRLWQIQITGTGTRVSTLLSTGPVHVDNHNLVVFEDGGTWRLLNANDGGIGVSSSQASSWSKPTLGMNTSQFYGVDKRPGASAYVGGMQDNGTWRSPVGTTAVDLWTFQIGGDGYETSWHFDDPMKIIGGYQYNGLQRSLDGGLSWSNATSGLADTGGGSAPFITKIAKSQDAPDLLFVVGAQGVWRSTNFGGSWSLSPIAAPDWAPISSFTDVRISRADPDVVWAGARMDGTGKINVSTDGGVTFNPTTNYTTVTMGGISGLSTHPSDPGTAYVLFSFAQMPKVLRTVDYGASWEDLSGFESSPVSANGFPDVAVYDLLVFPHDTDTIWVGTEIGLFESTDDGTSWHMANNGLPNVPIWFMTQVEDQIVLATHGRGIWSVEIPALTAGETYKPLIDDLYQGPDGFLTIDANLRSSYDYTEVRVDGNLVDTLPANPSATSQVVQFPVNAAATLQVQLIAYKDGVPYDSVVRSVDVVPLQAARFTYANDFNTASNDFFGSGFSIGAQAGFSTDAIHSPHPYASNTNDTYLLTVPIAVAPSNALVEFDEVVIVEPGESGSAYGDSDFWDYVIVEGSLDGVTWLPLLDGYDCREQAVWLSAYNTGTPGDGSMLRHRSIDLLQTFDAGDQILVRLRLYADQFVTGWGWAIDNLEIQTGPTAVDGDRPGLPSRFALLQNAPNPFNPKTSIRYQLPVESEVSLKIYDLRGREIRTLVRDVQEAGVKTVTWDGTDDHGGRVSSGTYVYRLVAGDFVQQKKMLLVK